MEGAVVMELEGITWTIFTDTGDIDAYLLYKRISEDNKEKEKWEASEKKVLL